MRKTVLESFIQDISELVTVLWIDYGLRIFILVLVIGFVIEKIGFIYNCLKIFFINLNIQIKENTQSFKNHLKRNPYLYTALIVIVSIVIFYFFLNYEEIKKLITKSNDQEKAGLTIMLQRNIGFSVFGIIGAGLAIWRAKLADKEYKHNKDKSEKDNLLKQEQKYAESIKITLGNYTESLGLLAEDTYNKKIQGLNIIATAKNLLSIDNDTVNDEPNEKVKKNTQKKIFSVYKNIQNTLVDMLNEDSIYDVDTDLKKTINDSDTKELKQKAFQVFAEDNLDNNLNYSIKEVSLKEVNLIKFDLDNMTFNNATFDNMTFNKATFKNTTFNKATFKNTTFDNSTFNNLTLENSRITAPSNSDNKTKDIYYEPYNVEEIKEKSGDSLAYHFVLSNYRITIPDFFKVQRINGDITLDNTVIEHQAFIGDYKDGKKELDISEEFGENNKCNSIIQKCKFANYEKVRCFTECKHITFKHIKEATLGTVSSHCQNVIVSNLLFEDIEFVRISKPGKIKALNFKKCEKILIQLFYSIGYIDDTLKEIFFSVKDDIDGLFFEDCDDIEIIYSINSSGGVEPHNLNNEESYLKIYEGILGQIYLRDEKQDFNVYRDIDRLKEYFSYDIREKYKGSLYDLVITNKKPTQ